MQTPLGLLAYRKPDTSHVFFKMGKWRSIHHLSQEGFVVFPFENQKGGWIFEEEKELDLNTFFSYYTFSSINNESSFFYEKEDYINTLSKTINLLKLNELKKIVFSRIKKRNHQSKALEIFKNILKYDNAFVYAIQGPFGSWMGASPEVLLKSNKNDIHTVALAATQVYKDECQEYEWGEKEIEEQRMVGEFIERIFEEMQLSYNRGVLTTVRAGNLAHLKNEYKASVNDLRQLSELILKLHPTPAVGGIPRDEAIDFIKTNEKHKRELYTGFLGEYSSISSELYVNLRCMKLFRDSAHIYVGGGITSSSIAESEWDETKNKSKVMLNTLRNKH